MICTKDMAIVLASYSEIRVMAPELSKGADSAFIYRIDGSTDRVAIPSGYVDKECVQRVRIGDVETETPCTPPWNARLQPSFDDRGNLVLASRHNLIAGAIVNLATGCHTLVRKDPGRAEDILKDDSERHIRMVGVRGDSVLVFHNDRGAHRGRPTIFANSAVKASIHPTRRIGGEPCAGMMGAG